jgi:hypothetical protein
MRMISGKYQAHVDMKVSGSHRYVTSSLKHIFTG